MKIALIPLFLVLSVLSSQAQAPEKVCELVHASMLKEITGECVWSVEQYLQRASVGDGHRQPQLLTVKTQVWGPNHWYFSRHRDQDSSWMEVYSTSDGLLFIERNSVSAKNLTISRHAPDFPFPYVPTVAYFQTLECFSDVASLHYAPKGDVGLLEVKSGKSSVSTVFEINPNTYAWISITKYANGKLLRRLSKDGEKVVYEGFEPSKADAPTSTVVATLQFRNPGGGSFKGGIYRIPAATSISSDIRGFHVSRKVQEVVVGRRLNGDLVFVD